MSEIEYTWQMLEQRAKDVSKIMKEKYDSLEKKENVFYIMSYFAEGRFYLARGNQIEEEVLSYRNAFNFYNDYFDRYMPKHFKDYYHLQDKLYDGVSKKDDSSSFTYEIVDCNNWEEQFRQEHPYSGIDDFLAFYYVYCHTSRFYQDTLTLRTPFYFLNYVLLYFTNPEIEKLIKCEDFQKIVLEWVHNPKEELFLRNFKSGNSIDEITGFSKSIWHELAQMSDNIKTYNEMRIMVQKEKLSSNELEDLSSLNLKSSGLVKTKKLCLKKINGQRIYDLKTIIRYLRRVDMYQAIYPHQSIDILYDYVNMSAEMGVIPITESNALKREHDVCIRNYNIWRQSHSLQIQENLIHSFNEVSEKMKKYEWEDDNYIVVAPKEIQDLINEGINNHNCVGSYIKDYAKGKAAIFFIRKKDDIEKSYITIEVKEHCTSVGQAYLGFNRAIESKQDLNFIQRWINHNKVVNQQLVENT